MKMNHLIMANLAVSSMLLTLIWLVQVLHYPSFRFIDAKNFVSFELFHKASISSIVMPLMAAEVLILALMIFQHLNSIPLLTSLGLVVLVWLVTVIYSIPCHEELSFGAKPEVIERLISTNWVRTLAWTFKFFISVYIYFYQGVVYERF